MKYLSVCSGIEAASLAWKGLGWKAVAFSEIESFPSEVLKHHYKETPNLGDMNNYDQWKLESIDLLVGGTPCQSFSVAGLRQGLKDPRGNLMLTYLGIAESYRPRWLVWENVPGVLSSAGGRDFGTFLGALVELGYGFAYRVLDAQWFGVAQRRRRVFVVGYLGDAGRAAKVLFESESLQRHPAPSREAGKRVAATLTGGFGERSVDADQIANGNYSIAACLRSGGNGGVPSSRGEHLVVSKTEIKWQSPNGKDIVGAMRARDYKGIGNDDLTEGRGLAVAYAFEPGIAGREGNESRFTHEVTGTLRKAMGDNQTAVALAFHPTQDPISSENISHALGAGGKSGTATTAVAFENNRRDGARVYGDTTNTLQAFAGTGGGNSPMVQHSTAVRRLTPTECERLQGFPDGYTAIPWKKKTADQCPDGPRYKALGNSMAVPVMRWIGERINKVNKEQS